MIFSKLWGYVVAAGAAIAALAAIFFKGRIEGKKSEKAKQAQSDIKAQEVRNETNKAANEVANDVARLPDDAVQQRLRDKYSRD